MSCLFDSIGTLLCEPTDVVRQMVCDYLAQNNQLMEGMNTDDILRLERSDYVTWMRKPTSWGGAIEIQTCVKIWNVNIHVENLRDKEKTMEFVSNIPNAKTIVIQWTGNHFIPKKYDSF